MVGDISFVRFHVDLATSAVRREDVRCADLEDALGGIARGFKLLEDRAVHDAYAPEATLVMNLGLLSGTEFMTGLRTFFHAYSPLKTSRGGAPAAMWTAGSGMSPGPEFAFLDARDLAGQGTNRKIQDLHARYADAHFAVLGPAGENYETCRYAAIALSTVNQLKSGDNKARFCGRGGIGGVMGSKNLLAIAADTPEKKGASVPPLVKEINLEVARGDGSRRFRDRKRHNGGGGTWANYEALGPVHAVPEMNFAPTGTNLSFPLFRPAVEETGRYVIRDEACYRCGIRCHKNLYDRDDPQRFRAKLDYEPLNLLSGNVGLFDVDRICDLVELTDQLGMDSISLGGSLAYACEYNRRHPDRPIADGLRYGDADALEKTIAAIGTGRLGLLGQGSKRLSEELGETGYAMHCKGVEFPAYLPQTNPGYPFALAGGHMSMQTYLLLLYERETGLDYWVDAITRRGLAIMRDDLVGICKFSGMPSRRVAEAIEALTGLEITGKELSEAVLRTYLRGYRIERQQGFGPDDYDLPAEVHREYSEIDLPHFLTAEFFAELKTAVLARFDAMLTEADV
ncbi:MAG: aldehyde ferredoxin oxidoreductase C-terminal domain-containing protein [Planctomycetota bacterium]|jgi:aldehyde:ferredoxin oxidoreductase